MGVDGSAHVFSPANHEVITLAPDGSERAGFAASASDGSAIAAIGPRSVVLDEESGTLYGPDVGTVDLSSHGSTLALQQSGPDRSSALVATPGGLLEVDLSTGDIETVWPGEDEPIRPGGGPLFARPLRLGSCTFGAWITGSDVVTLQWCDGDEPIPNRKQHSSDVGTTADAPLFRHNRGRVVLNHAPSGMVFVLEDGEADEVDNWQDTDPEPVPTATTIPGPGDTETEESESEDEENTPPTANDDELGARAGVPTVLPILDNDIDPDGDLLWITEITAVSDPPGAVEVIDDGRAVQFTAEPRPDQTDTFTTTFDYAITDGEHSDTARVTVTSFPPETNEPPEPKDGRVIDDHWVGGFDVASGGKARYVVLDDWIDPEGDPISLVSATTAEPSDTVRSSPGGIVTFIDGGVAVNPEKAVDVVVTDGTNQASGPVRVSVKTTEEPPILRDDLASAQVGETITIHPLANDSDPNGDDLRLTGTSPDPVPGATVTSSSLTGEILFSADEPGDYRFDYSATDGEAADSTAEILVRVTESEGNQPPVAVADIVRVPAGRTALVDLLANDFDPDGDVLVVQRIETPQDPALSVALIGNQQIRAEVDGSLTGPVHLTYQLSDGGTDTVTGHITVVAVDRATGSQPPVAVDDHTVVREGDVVSIPVLANDIDPEGERLELLRVVPSDGAETGSAQAFVAGDEVRYLAPLGSSSVQFSYEIADAEGNIATGEVRISVRPVDAENNAPTPRSVEARVLAGSSVRIPIPLAGADPDGDWVTLSVASAPSAGSVEVIEGRAMLLYEARPNAAGTDEFTYRLTDTGGAYGEARVRVGIAPSAGGQPPVAFDDRVDVSPKAAAGSVRVPVLVNDIDPDGDAVILTEELSSSPGVVAEVIGEVLAVTVEGALDAGASEYAVDYQITDGRGGTDWGTLTVVVREDARGLSPIARDDVIEVVDPSDATEVVVSVLDNDEDPDGPKSELVVTLPEERPGVVLDPDDPTVTIELTDRPQIVVYEIADQNGDESLDANGNRVANTSRAFIRVPALAGTTNRAPQPQEDAAPLSIAAGESAVLDVGDFVTDPDGDELRLTDVESIQAVGGYAEPDSPTSIQFTADDNASGSGSVSFEVADRGDEDPDRLTSFITVPIAIVGRNLPPVVEPVTLEVPKGESSSIDVLAYVQDPDPDDTPTIESIDDTSASSIGFTVERSGSTLEVSAAVDVETGTEAVVQYTVTDGENEPVLGEVTVRVTASSMPLPTATLDTAVADELEEVSIDVLDNDTDPIGDGLTVVGIELFDPRSEGQVRFDATSVRFTPVAGPIRRGARSLPDQRRNL